MRLQSFTLGDFQSYRTQQRINFAPDVTLLAGRNNVGKTALLRGMRHLTNSQPGMGPNRVLEFEWRMDAAEFEQAIPLSTASVFEPTRQAIASEGKCVLRAELRAAGAEVQRHASFQSNGVAGAIADFQLARLIVPGTDLNVVPTRNQSQGNNVQLWWDNTRLESDQATAGIVPLLWNMFVAGLTSIAYVHPRRSSEPRPFQQVSLALDPDAGNLTTVVATLYNNSRYELWPRLEDFMRDVFPEVRHVEVRMLETSQPPTAEIYMRYGQSGGLSVPLMFSGTGVEQVLMLATAILTAPSSRCFLIDEPHAYLHPAAERGLLRFLRLHPEHQYVIATHSAAFLTAYPISHARLITMEDQGSRVSDVGDVANILEHVGVTAADLWSANSILWVEGPSEVDVISSLIPSDVEGTPVAVRAMPDAVRNSARKPTLAKQMIEFCSAVTSAILPVQVEMAFLFDSDEKKNTLKSEIESATRNKAHFLPMRELENFFLVPEAIHADLVSQCSDLGVTVPTLEQVRQEINDELAKVNDAKLYPTRDVEAGEVAVVGSEVLERIYSNWTLARYEKVRDGVRLAKRVRELNPARLSFLVNLIDWLRHGAAQG